MKTSPKWHGHLAREGAMAGMAIAKADCGHACPRSFMARMAMPRAARLMRIPAATLAGLLMIVAAGLLLAGCESGGTAANVALPVVTLSPTTASVTVGLQLQLTAQVVSPTSTTLTWSVNNIVGGNSTLGTITTSGLYTAPAAVPNPAAVTIKATSSAETYPYGSALVTVMSAPGGAFSLAPTDSTTPAGSTVPFSASLDGSVVAGATWSVNGVAGGNSTVGTITSAGVYTAPTSAPSPATVVLTAANPADNSETSSTTVTVTAPNTAALFVNFGPNGNTGNPNTTYYNGVFTTVNVCLPATTVCQVVPDILVDTGSVGLRVLNSALTAVPATEFGTIKDSTGNQVQECVQFGDTSYAWGPIYFANVDIAGEVAATVPFQVIGGANSPVPASSCLTLGSGPSLDTVAALGANGILGVGTSVQDCGGDCASGQTFSGYPYYVCPNNVCQTVPLTLTHQVANPVAFFTKDNNGVTINLPPISPAGALVLPYTDPTGATLVPAGVLTFGVGTQSNNALGSATLYATDANGNFPQVVYNGVTYTSGGFLDTGSNALYVSDPATLGILNCTDNPYYCPAAPLPLALTVYGMNSTSGMVNLNIANADILFGDNPTYSAFNNLGGQSGTGLGTDYFDLGLPFFFGRTTFVGIAGTTIPNNVSAPNGYFAF